MAVTRVTTTVNSSYDPSTQDIITLKVRMTEQENVLSAKVMELDPIITSEAGRVASEAIRESNNATMSALVTGFEGQLAGKASQASLDTTNTNLAAVDAQLADAVTQLASINANVLSNTTAVTLKANKAYVDTLTASIASGSPKGTYANLAALQSAYPAGNTNIYVLAVDGNWYYWNGSAWTSGGVYQSTVGVAVPSKNLFNKATATIGYYVDETTGGLMANAEFYTTDYIPASPSTSYIKNLSLNRTVFYDLNKVYISGSIPPANSYIFTTPINCAFVKTSELLANIDITQIELGAVSTTYNSFGNKIVIKNSLVVAKLGGDYNTINQAMAVANDTIDNPMTIQLMPGVYVESLNLIGRYISIVGINKETCIIKTFTNDYYNPPIDLSTGSHLANLTIIADDNGTTTPPAGVGGMPAYAIHFDIAGRGFDLSIAKYQGISRVKNCILISKHQHAAGIGISYKQHLIWEDCEFIAYDTNPAFRAHNYMLTGGILGKMTTKNCTMHNDGTVTPIVLQDPNHGSGGGYDNVDTIFTFINTTAWSEVGGQANALSVPAPFDATCVAGYIKKGKGSYGNSILALNA